MRDIFFNITAFIILVLTGLLLLHLACCVIRTISDSTLKRFALKNDLNFSKGKCNLFSFAVPGEVFGNWHGYKIRITYSYISAGWRYVALGNISTYLWADNPSKSKLNVSKVSFFTKSKRKEYFNDEWDNKLLIESRPTAFGKHLLNPLKLRKAVFESQRFRAPISSFISIHKDGQIHIFQRHALLTTRRILNLLHIVEELAIATAGYSP
jgi:hypothetical protein